MASRASCSSKQIREFMLIGVIEKKKEKKRGLRGNIKFHMGYYKALTIFSEIITK